MPHLVCRRSRSLLLASCFTTLASLAHGQLVSPPAAAPARGQLLYNTHCIECHNTQMHWRANSQVRDWQGLLAQVTRWQANAGLGWSGNDVREVARHLNDSIYRLPLPEQKASR